MQSRLESDEESKLILAVEKESVVHHQKTGSQAHARHMPVTGETVTGQKIHKERGCHSSMCSQSLYFVTESQKEKGS